MNPLPPSHPFTQNSNHQTNLKTASLPSDSAGPRAWPAPHSLSGIIRHGALLAFVAAVALCAGPAQAANLLLNPSFETNNGNVVPTSWTYFTPPNVSAHDYWIVSSNSVGCSHMAPHSGTYFWKEWFIHNNTNNVAGLSQTFSSSPGSIYNASGWLATSTCDILGADCATWIQVEFLDASTNLVALYKSAIFSPSAALDTWVQFQVTNACDLTQPVSVGDPYFTTYAVTGSVSQLVAPFGTASVRYRFCYLTVGSEGGSAFCDDAVLNQLSGPTPPVISALFPQDSMIFVNPTSGISFTASSPSGFTINNSGIHLTVNGTNVSGGLAITGSASSKNVAYQGLQSNSTYTASISVTDVSNLTVNATIQFQTMWFGVLPSMYLWEAEDWDFSSGMYIDNPDLCSASGDPNCYFGKVGVQNVDENNSSGASGPYRSGDPMGTLAAGDALRPNLFAAARTDYRIDPFNGGEWVNYTRDWPNSTNWVIARVSANLGDSGSLTLSLVNPDSSTTALGTFSINAGLGYSTFENVYLKDNNGNNALVTLNGKQTLRVTSGGNVLPNFFMLVAAQADVPQLSNVYPTGTHPFEYTNTFSFTATALGSSFPANGISVNLDGYDVTSNLVITGSASVKNVVLRSLLPNAIHVAITTVTNSLGRGIAVTNNFDTFSEGNYMVELEDFDYDSGQFLENVLPDSYANLFGVTNVDYQHTILNGESYPYRAPSGGVPGIPEDALNQHDWLRSNFVYWGGVDYVLTFFAANDWANYTRTYPVGNFYAYVRSSGDGPFSLYIDQVVSGAGTVNQVTKRLGHFGGFGRSPVYITYDWAPLTDDGLAAPAVVTLNGQATLRLTTGGNCNPNYVMLVPTSGINLKAASAGASTVLSFASQAGVSYRVFYRTNLTAGTWTTLTNVLGTGAIRSVSDPHVGTSRFYKVTAP
jgi:hypothetical protein